MNRRNVLTGESVVDMEKYVSDMLELSGWMVNFVRSADIK